MEKSNIKLIGDGFISEGEYNNIKWPESGNNPKLISIKHIEQPTE